MRQNYGHQKRQKELAKKQKQALKLQRKLGRKEGMSPESEAESAVPAGEETQEQPGESS